MDSRNSRRAAEKATRALLHTRAAVVGDLAVAGALRTTAEERLTAAAGGGQALIEAGHAQAAQLLTDAQTALDNAHTSYAATQTAAVDAGWQPAELRSLGYPAPNSRRRRARPAPPAHDAGDVLGMVQAESPAEQSQGSAA